MRDSDQMHAVCLDTTPRYSFTFLSQLLRSFTIIAHRCVYLNDTSHAVADLVKQINAVSKKDIVSKTKC